MADFSIAQLMRLTKQSSRFSNRYFFQLRDTLRQIKIQRVRSTNIYDLKDSESFMKIISYSYPQYKPYTNVKGRYSSKQRKIKHQYSVILQIDDSMNINSRNWKIRVGSEKNPRPAPQNMIKSIKRSTSKKLQKQAERKFTKVKDQKDWIKKRKEEIRKKGKYLTESDWQSQILGINHDFLYRLEYIANKHGFLYSHCRATRPPVDKRTNPKQEPFLDKHSLNTIQALLKSGVLRYF